MTTLKMTTRFVVPTAPTKYFQLNARCAFAQTLPLAKVTMAQFNPVSRHEVELLKKTMAAKGQLKPISVVESPSGNYMIADGHRRFLAAQELGWGSIRADVYTSILQTEADAARLLNELFVELNAATRAFNGRDRLNVALQDGPTFDPNTKSAKLQIESIFATAPEREFLVARQITTTVLNVAKKSTKYVLGSDIGQDTPTYQKRLKNHILYLLRNPIQQAMIAYMRMDYDSDALKKAIDNNRPVPRTSSPRIIETWKK